MKDVLVSIRMPASMLTELQALAKKNHFMDVSEEIRTVTRQKVKECTQPYALDVKKIVDDIQEELRGRESMERKGEAITRLRRLLEDLEHG